MNYPKITVVTPSFNQGNFIERTIQSVLSQKYPNLEYIIIDGGSTDNSVDIIQKYKNDLAYWISEPDNGLYNALNKGFKVSTGEIMTYINSDDILQAHSLFTIAEIFSSYNQIEWLNGIPNQIDEYDRMIWIGGLPNWTKYHYLNKQFKYIQQEGCFWRRSLWNKANGFIASEYKMAGDLELWSRFFSYEKLYYIPVIIGSFRIRSENQKTFSSLESYNDEAKIILDKFYDRANKVDKKLVQKYNSILGKVLRKTNIQFLFTILGYIDVYRLFDKNNDYFTFDRITQSFKLNIH